MCSSGDGRHEQVPVARLREDGVPVGDVEQRGQPVAADLPELVRVGEHEGEHDDAGQQPGQRGQQPAGPAGPEPAEVDAALLPPLGQQQRADQEAGQHEEQVDAEVAADQEVGVEQQHAGHRRAPQAVEGRDVAQQRRAVGVLARVAGDDRSGPGAARGVGRSAGGRVGRGPSISRGSVVVIRPWPPRASEQSPTRPATARRQAGQHGEPQAPSAGVVPVEVPVAGRPRSATGRRRRGSARTG